MKTLLAFVFLVIARADTIPPLSFGTHPDLGYFEYLPPLTCDGNICSGNRYFPEAESPDGHWVGISIFDLDIDANLWLWHDGEYLATNIYGPWLTVTSIDNSGVAKGWAAPCYDREAGIGGGTFSTDVGCIVPVQPVYDAGFFVAEFAEFQADVPEPATWVLLAGVVLGIGFVRRRG